MSASVAKELCSVSLLGSEKAKAALRVPLGSAAVAGTRRLPNKSIAKTHEGQDIARRADSDE
ncbi:hypothetical protein CAI21_05555 [Alkalilimnicola ehrlichii]|uniref:Uncharacterized protein n=1 Tax=Alkalilimnicola ehrlichii TaxID=351052 RepID=A0A3E0WYJ7_9GAMM|nr:hypothetical protein CAI21_05555 [Alkalilimnicola ehrlichii]RFA38062.1 hypothetical protein CAL65_06925 [Alkalilimnicola ehrlichii]